MNIREEFMDIFAEELRKEIDAEIMFELFKSEGWYPVVDCHRLNFNHPLLKQVEEWLTTMPAGKYHIKSHTEYIFQLKEDALMFQLKWT